MEQEREEHIRMVESFKKFQAEERKSWFGCIGKPKPKKASVEKRPLQELSPEERRRRARQLWGIAKKSIVQNSFINLYPSLLMHPF